MSPKTAIAGVLIACAAYAQQKTVDFQRDVRPILSDNCFHCHGPDASTRMAGLRLDLKEDALAARRRGAAIVPRKPSESLVYTRIAEANPARRMPPLSSHKTLTKDQIATIQRWIEQGADWPEHWAYKAPVKHAPPSVKAANWVRNPIDRFILARLEAEKLTPAPEASKRTLIRRVALDLTGLPPTLADIERFLADKTPQAYENMVDRYLASPHYGENRARYWLDAARYADTHGIHIDNYREIWPYRDWVIEAYNRNVPFDRFTIEQLAGDLLPNPTLDQRIATGFHRANATTSEGGAIDDEYYEIYAKDRADTTGAVWLGLTVGCATCHDHKFDPIKQKEFYALGAFFRNTPQKAMDGNVADTPPILFVPHKDDREAWAKIQTRRAEVRAAVRDALASPPAGFKTWTKTDGPLEYTSVLFVPARIMKGEVAGAPKLSAEEPFTISIQFTAPENLDRNIPIASHKVDKEKSRGWSFDLIKGQASFRLVGEDGKSIGVRTALPIAPGAHHVAVSYDGSRHQTGLMMYFDGREVFGQGRDSLDLTLPGSIAVEGPMKFGEGVRDFRVFERTVTESEAGLLARWGTMEGRIARYLHAEDAGFRKFVEVERELQAETRKIRERGSVTHVMHENPGTPAAHVLFRGAYDQKRDLVEATTPSILPPMTADLPRNRLGFAKWLFKPDHPLTARVTVNRMWQEIFGTGIVKTVDDFGSQGEPPSHPELLDWLATDFRDSGWDVKRFYKQILMSATYRQEAAATPAKLAKDPDNRLLSRGPRFRLDAETVRDYTLTASGLLARQIGGPSVRPYQPDGVWEAVAMKGSNTRFYTRDDGESLYRRSMYTFWKRSAPPANMEIFNAPTRENCTVRRERTNTPLQALVTMNDDQFVEASRVLAERAMQNTTSWQARSDLIAERVLARTLTPAETKIMRGAFDDYLKHYEAKPDDARKLLSVGEKNYDPSLDPAEFAAWTMVANGLFNMDEALNK